MRRVAWVSSFSFLFATAAACGSDATPDTAEAEVGTGADDQGTEDTGAPVDVPARGIWLTSVEVNQGVAIEIGRDGAWVDGSQRNAPLLRDRDTLVRGFWAFNEGWEPRLIEARLNLFFVDGTTTEYRQVLMVDGESTAGDIMRTFYFGLLAEEVRPGMQYQISLYETQAEFAGGDDPDPLPVTPVDAPNFIGIEDAPMEMYVHVVPFNADWPGCTRSPDLSEETMQLFEDRLYQRNPLVEMSLIIEPTIDFSVEPTSFWEFFADIDDVRLASGLGPNHYWYGLVDACGDLDGAGGLAMSIPPPTQQAGRERIAAGSSGSNADFSATTIVHEIGHLQGLRHVSCASSPTDHDPAFPYEDAKIGVWGFGIRDFALRHPDVARDYMSYCYGGSWTADWSWWKNFARINTLTSWDYGGGAPSPEPKPLLVGVVSADGTLERWWVSEGSLGDEGFGNATVAFTGASGTESIPGYAHPLADSDAITIAAPLPALGLAGIDSVEVRGAGVSAHTVAVAAIRPRHRP